MESKYTFSDQLGHLNILKLISIGFHIFLCYVQKMDEMKTSQTFSFYVLCLITQGLFLMLALGIFRLTRYILLDFEKSPIRGMY